jgi:hypothetical protein
MACSANSTDAMPTLAAAPTLQIRQNETSPVTNFQPVQAAVAIGQRIVEGEIAHHGDDGGERLRGRERQSGDTQPRQQHGQMGQQAEAADCSEHQKAHRHEAPDRLVGQQHQIFEADHGVELAFAGVALAEFERQFARPHRVGR